MDEVNQMYKGSMQYIRVHDPAQIAKQIDEIKRVRKEDFNHNK